MARSVPGSQRQGQTRDRPPALLRLFMLFDWSYPKRIALEFIIEAIPWHVTHGEIQLPESICVDGVFNSAH